MIPISYHRRGTSDRHRSQNGFYTPMRPITPSVEELILSLIRPCRVQRVYIINSKYWGTKMKSNRREILYKQTKSKGKITIVTSLLSSLAKFHCHVTYNFIHNSVPLITRREMSLLVSKGTRRLNVFHSFCTRTFFLGLVGWLEFNGTFNTM